jgi:hypothetical protein
MAYETSNPIKKVSGGVGGAKSVWYYEDGDALSAIDATSYFDLEAARLKVGDTIIARGNSVNGITTVVSNTRDLAASPPVEGVVDVANFTSLQAIDSD